MTPGTIFIVVVGLLFSAPNCVYSHEDEDELVRMATALRGNPRTTSSIEGSASLRTMPAKRLPGGQRQSLTVGNGCTYATIGQAIAAANPGDELLLEGDVTFTENIHITLDLVMRGGYDGCASASTERTTLDGANSNSVVRIDEGLDVALYDLVISNGLTTGEGGGIVFAEGTLGGTLYLEHVRVSFNQARWGGGIWVGRGATVTGANVSIEGNTATEAGGGLRLYGGSATFAGFLAIGMNDAPQGGGVYATAVGDSEPVLTVVDANIFNNEALTGEGTGGGVYMDHGTLNIDPGMAPGRSVNIELNEALSGAAIYVVDSVVEVSSYLTSIAENEAWDDGGGIYAVNSSLHFEKGVTIADNWAGADYVRGDGGGLFLDNSDFFSSWASIYSNRAWDSGAGIFATNGSTIEIEQAYFGSFQEWSGVIRGNQAYTGLGGALSLFNSTARLTGIPIHGNSARIGGGIYAYDSSIVAASCTITVNDAADDVGDGIRLNGSASLIGRGLTIAGNDSDSGVGVSVLAPSTLDLGCSIVFNHATSIDTPGHTVTFCDIEGGYPGTANIDVDPVFVDPPGDTHLQATSPLIDLCPAISTVVTDIDAEVRPWVLTNPLLPFDMGADEVGAPAVALFLDDFELGDTSAWSQMVP